MILFCLLCVSLVLGGWAVRREVREVCETIRRHLFGVRVRILRRPEPSRTNRARIPLGAVPSCPLPPPNVATRIGP